MTLEDAIAEYLQLSESNRPMDQDSWIAQYPKWSDELREFIANYKRMEEFGGEMRRRRRQVAHANPFGTELKYFGEYELLEQIGRGGMGIVFKARQASLDRLVALKMLLDSSQDRFRAEAEAAAALSHPNIVTIYEIGEHDGWPYYTMEYVDGRDLSQLSDGQPFDSTQAAEVLLQLARAVQFAHDRGVLHRDLKPANVMVDKLGTPQIADFGLAKVVAESPVNDTATGIVLGTPSYMAPEQAAGDQKLVTVGTDVYGLGSILYRLLTGTAPFSGENSLVVMRQVECKAPISPRKVCSDVPEDLEKICLKCLEKVPRDRYESARALADDLERFLEGKPVVASPIGPLERSRRWCLRNPTIAVLAATVLLLFIGSSIGGFWMARSERMAHKTAETARRREAAARQQAETSLVESFVSNGRSARQRRDWAESLLWHSTAADLAQSNHQRDVNNMRVRVRSHEVGEPIRANLFDGGLIRLLQFHPISRYLLVGDGKENTVCWDLAADTPWSPLSEDASVAQWSADGKWLLLGATTGDVEVVDLDSGLKRSLFTLDGSIKSIAIDDHGHQVAAAFENEVALTQFDAGNTTEGGSKPTTWSPSSGVIGNISLDAQGSHLVVHTTNGKALVFDVTNWPVQKIHSIPADYQASQIDHPSPARPQFLDARRLLVYDNPYARVFDITSGDLIRKLQVGRSRFLEVDKTGKRILNGGDRRARIRSLNGKSQSRLMHHRGFVVGGEFHPIRDEIALGGWDRQVVIRDGKTAQRIRVLPHQTRVVRVVHSPCGELVATAQDDGLVRVWNLRRSVTSLRRIATPGNGSRAEFFDDHVVFTGGATTGDSGIRTLTMTDQHTGISTELDVDLKGELVHAAPEETCNELFTLTKLQSNETELLRVAIDNTSVLARATVESGVRLVNLSDGVAVVTAFGQLKVFDRNLVETGSINLRKNTYDAGSVSTAKLMNSVLVGHSNQVDLVDVDKLKTIEKRVFSDRVTSVAISPDRTQLAAGLQSGELYLWSTEQSSLRHKVASSGRVYSTKFSPDGKSLIVAGADGSARLVATGTGEFVGKPIIHENDVFDATFSRNGKFVYTVGDNGLLNVSDASDGRHICHIRIVSGDKAKRPTERRLWLSLSNTGDRLLACGLAANARLCDTSSFESSSTNVDTRRQRLFYELVCNQRVNNGTLVPIGTVEWLDTWRRFCSEFGRPTNDSLLATPSLNFGDSESHQDVLR